MPGKDGLALVGRVGQGDELVELLPDLQGDGLPVLGGQGGVGPLDGQLVDPGHDVLDLHQGLVRQPQPPGGRVDVGLVLLVGLNGVPVIQDPGHAHRVVRGPVDLLLGRSLEGELLQSGRRVVQVLDEVIVEHVLRDAHGMTPVSVRPLAVLTGRGLRVGGRGQKKLPCT